MIRKQSFTIVLLVVVATGWQTSNLLSADVHESLTFKENLPFLQDEQYRTACGPIACYVALNALGKATTLDDAARKCDWAPNHLTTLSQMQFALSAVGGIECVAARLSPQELCRLLKNDDTVVILAVRQDTEKIDHAFCAVGVRNDDAVRIIDYPTLGTWKMLGEVTEVWDGPALVVRVSSSRRAWRNLCYAFVPTVVVVALLSSIGQGVGKLLKRRSGSGSVAADSKDST